MSVLIRVQHRPTRPSLIRLLEGLPRAEIIGDWEDPPNPWRGYRRCLEDLPSEGHVVILQDDTIVCRNFGETIERIAAVDANRDSLVSLFLSTVPKRTLNRASLHYGKNRYVENHNQDLVHVVALLWPVAKAREFLAWVDENPARVRGSAFQSDDATVSRWVQLTKQRVRCTVPSIVEHPDDVPSVVNAHRPRAGGDSGRVAAYWIKDEDPLELDWSR